MTNLFDLPGSRAIVTGGTRGLGHGMAEGLMEAGASVVIFGSSDKVEKVAADFRAHASDYLNGAVIPVDGGYLVK